MKALSIDDWLVSVTHANAVVKKQRLQSLWSGYGEISRFYLSGSDKATVIVKSVSYPDFPQHPKGWASDRGHQRKIQSYEVEKTWYQQWAHKTNTQCRVPNLIASRELPGQVQLVLEDMDAAGFDLRLEQVNLRQRDLCLAWLANFHANFIQITPNDLWQTGCYWHLATRPDEWNAMASSQLKDSAQAINDKLEQIRFKTLVHGDAKLANFCFAESSVVAVDFQYVGVGSGVRDLAYFVGSCFNQNECFRYGDEILSQYFFFLHQALIKNEKNIDSVALELEWRHLYPFAWADFERFLQGWKSDHYKINAYSEYMTSAALKSLSDDAK